MLRAAPLAVVRLGRPRTAVVRRGAVACVYYSSVSIPDAPVLQRRTPAAPPANAWAFTTQSAQLIQRLESQQRMPPEDLWRMYTSALNERPYAASDGSLQVPPRLEARHHELVLRALLPAQDDYAAYRRERRRLAEARCADLAGDGAPAVPGALDLSTPQSLAPVPPVKNLGGAVATAWARRWRYVLSRIPGESRTTDMYNRVLAILALGGRYNHLLRLWDDMVELRAQGHLGAAPNEMTCHHMIAGLVRNFAQKLRRYRARYRRELLSLSYRRISGAERQAAAEHVQAAADQAASTVSMLLRDMQGQATPPRTQTLDLAARLLRATGKLPSLLELLRVGFGLDLDHPDTDAPALGAPTTQTLNTTLMALGELARAPDMVSAFEVMTQRLQAAPAAVADVFDSDLDELETDVALDADAPAPPAPADGDGGAVLPNTTSFKLLIRHAVTVPQSLLVSNASMQSPSWLARLAQGPQSTPSMGIRTPAQREDEIASRARGQYLYLARTYLDTALATHAAQVAHMAERLGVEPPAALSQPMDVVHARAAARRAAQHTGDTRAPRSSRRLWRSYCVVERDLDAVLDRAAAPAPVPVASRVFVPPRVRATWTMMRPLLDAAKPRRSIGQLLWLHARADYAAMLLAAEYDVLQRAHASLSPADVALSRSLAAHTLYVQQLWQDMSWLCDSRVPGRLHGWRLAEQERNARRNERAAQAPRRRKKVASVS